MCLVKYDINNVEIKKTQILKTSEECNSYSVHVVTTHRRVESILMLGGGGRNLNHHNLYNYYCT